MRANHLCYYFSVAVLKRQDQKQLREENICFGFAAPRGTESIMVASREVTGTGSWLVMFFSTYWKQTEQEVGSSYKAPDLLPTDVLPSARLHLRKVP